MQCSSLFRVKKLVRTTKKLEKKRYENMEYGFKLEPTTWSVTTATKVKTKIVQKKFKYLMNVYACSFSIDNKESIKAR